MTVHIAAAEPCILYNVQGYGFK